MPLQNRVTPFGAIRALPERGTLMGDRGIVHDGAIRMGERLAAEWRAPRRVNAAMAALSIRDGIGFLNVGATLPASRDHGLHTALTAWRVADAAQAGCELVIGETGFGTTSHLHMHRCGMALACNDLIWQDQTDHEGTRA
jgi:hypothetical protein